MSGHYLKKLELLYIKTGLQPVSRPVEQVHYFVGWVECSKSLWCQEFADRQTTMQDWRGLQMHKSVHNAIDKN